MQVIPTGDDISVSETHFDYSLTHMPIELDGGRFLALWSRYEWAGMPSGSGFVMEEVYARLYEADGTPVGAEFRINAGRLSAQTLATATPLDDGGFLVAFQTYSNNDSFLNRWGISTRRFDADGIAQTGDTLVAFNASAASESPLLTRLDNGTVLMTYLEDLPYPAPYTLKGMLLDASGTPMGTAFDIDTAGAPTAENRTATVLDNGNVMIAYTGLDADQEGIFIRIYTEAGVAVTDPIQVNTQTGGRQQTPVAVTLADGSVMVVWKSAPSEDMHDLYGRRFAADGTPLSDPVVLTADTAWDQNQPSVIALADGGFMIAFASGYVGYQALLRRFDANGMPIAEETFVSSDPDTADTLRPRLLELADGRIAAFWLEMVTSSSSQVMMRIFESQTFGTGDGESLVGTSGNDWIDALAGDDSLRGDDGSDDMRGGGGGDTMHGDMGNDTLRGNDGNDRMFGGADDDLMAGNDGQDTMRGEDGNDRMFGSNDDDVLAGNDGNDFLSGGNGNDRMFGGNGEDTLEGGVGADDMYGGNGNDDMYGDNNADTLHGDAGNDTLRGNDGDDRMFGDDGDDLMAGNDGQDTMRGGDGNDRMFGSNDDDVLAGNDGNDRLSGDSGNDRLFGGEGNDTLIGGAGQDEMTGNGGADVFVFTAVSDSAHGATRDTIMDFEAGIDLIDLTGFGGLSFVAAYTGAGNEVRYNDGIGRLYADIDADGLSDFSVDVGSGAGLTEDDLLL